MTSKLRRLIVSLLTAGVASTVTGVEGQRARSNHKLIQVFQLNRTKVIGSLGRPLGAIVTIEGIAADENYTRRKADTDERLLRVQSVNVRSLKREVVFHFRAFEGATIERPSAGMRFKYVGYETGGFSGIPEGAFAYIPRLPTKGYSFSTSFCILRDDNSSTGSMKN